MDTSRTEVTTYFFGNVVYLVDVEADFAYVYSRQGKCLGSGDGFEDYLDYTGTIPDKE